MHILELEIATAALPKQRDFYTRLLGAPQTVTADRLSFQIGRSRLTFAATPAAPSGSYHFAFNIPGNQFEEAKVWLRQHALPMTDEAGNDEFHSAAWDAHMLYFRDPDGNIAELIARHTLRSVSDLPFSGRSLLNISEIGIVTEDVAAQVAHLQESTGAVSYQWSGNPAFTPLGDENGLFIVVQHGRVWFPSVDVTARHLPVKVRVATGTGARTLSFGDSTGFGDSSGVW